MPNPNIYLINAPCDQPEALEKIFQAEFGDGNVQHLGETEYLIAADCPCGIAAAFGYAESCAGIRIASTSIPVYRCADETGEMWTPLGAIVCKS